MATAGTAGTTLAPQQATRLTDDEAAALRYASGPMVAMERLELLHFLGYPEEMPRDQVRAVVERILERRGFDPLTPEEAARG